MSFIPAQRSWFRSLEKIQDLMLILSESLQPFLDSEPQSAKSHPVKIQYSPFPSYLTLRRWSFFPHDFRFSTLPSHLHSPCLSQIMDVCGNFCCLLIHFHYQGWCLLCTLALSVAARLRQLHICKAPSLYWKKVKVICACDTQ